MHPNNRERERGESHVAKEIHNELLPVSQKCHCCYDCTTAVADRWYVLPLIIVT